MPASQDRHNPPRSARVMSRWLAAAAAALLIAGPACAPPAPVVQGKVVHNGAGDGQLLVQDELRPGDPPLRLDTSQAEVGTPPEPGDRVRVAYREVGGVNRALAVMNLSRQPESPDVHD